MTTTDATVADHEADAIAAEADAQEAAEDVPAYAGEMATDQAIELASRVGRELEYTDQFISFGPNFAVFSPDTTLEAWSAFVLALKNRVEFTEKSLPWLLGDAINFAELHNLGEGKYSQMLDATEYMQGTLQNMAYVARRWAPADRDYHKPWGYYRAAASLRPLAPQLAAALVDNAVEQGHTRQELAAQVNQASRQVRADRKNAPDGQLDQPKLATKIHNLVCPSCTCSGAATLDTAGVLKLAKHETVQRARKAKLDERNAAKVKAAGAKKSNARKNGNAKATPVASGRKRRAGAAEPTVIDGAASVVAPTVNAAPKPTSNRKRRPGPRPATVPATGPALDVERIGADEALF